MNRRRALQLFGVAGLGTVAAACAGPGSTASGGGSKVEGGDIGGELSFAHWRAEDKAVLDKIIKDFLAANKGVSIRQDISPSTDYQATALQRVKDAAIGDVFTALRGPQFSDMVKAGLFADLTNESVVDNYIPELIADGKGGGKQLGLPYQLVFLIPLANRDLLDKHGFSELPLSWDGFLDMCDKLKSKGITPMAFPGADAGNAGQLINGMVMNNAPSDDMFTKIESGEYKATDDWYLKTLEQYAQLRPYVQPNAAGTAHEPAQQIFASEQAALLTTGSYDAASVRALDADFAMDVFTPITVAKNEMKYEGCHNTTFILGVNTATDNQATALAFVEHLSDPEVAGTYANGTAQHVTIDGVEYDDRDLKAIEPWLSKNTLLAPRYQFTDLDIAAAVENAAIEVIGGTSPEQAAEEAQRIVDQRRK
ncbi:MAG: extracellular solute-binding protein [Actinophytocola sp.]|nr:extracellular solute-binding protein [Actinophytocola sp.]